MSSCAGCNVMTRRYTYIVHAVGITQQLLPAWHSGDRINAGVNAVMPRSYQSTLMQGATTL